VTGPVQVLVLGFDDPTFSGEVIAELARLDASGTARLLDVLLVERAQDGSLDTLPPPPGADPSAGRLAAALLERQDDGEHPGPDDGPAAETWSLDDVIPPGGIAAVALIEHTWAQPLLATIRRAGGQPLDETWLAPDDLALLDRLLGDRA
jgi:hypothetical protein